MSDPDYRLVRELFLAARELEGAERDALLRDRCGDDAALRSEVESLLQHQHRDPIGLSTPPTDVVDARQGVSRTTALPERIGRYEILGLLGSGGMGMVYRARQEQPAREVALKVIRPDLVTAGLLRRFRREARVLGRLQHPGIAQIFEAGAMEVGEGEQPFFALELVEGEPLDEYAQSRELAVRDRVALMIRVCRAIHHAHQKGVIHRDLKPANILVVASGDDLGQPKVLDFGIARLSNDGVATLHTRAGQVLGTLAYMSPEQASGNVDDLDVCSDVYTLGVILYELLAEKLPYDVTGVSIAEVARVIEEEEPSPLAAPERALGGDLDTIVSKALEKERERRYPSAMALADDLQRALNDEPIVARPTSGWYRFRKLARRRPSLVVGAAIAVLSLTVGLVVCLVLYAQAQRSLGDFTRMSDVRRMHDLIRRAEEEVWPVGPGLLPLTRAWLSEARQLASRLPSHQAFHAEIRARGTLQEDGIAFDQHDDEWQHDVMTEVVGLIGDLMADDPEKVGTIAEMEERQRRAATLSQRSIGDHGEPWQRAIDAIASSPKYASLRIQRQIGLVPLGVDPESGLWEFWHVESGTRPPRDEATRCLTATADSGIVLVLIPGGAFRMGAQNRDPGAPNFDPLAEDLEEPVHEVTAAPFFLSKFEMTQGQWLRIRQENPSSYVSPAGGTSVTLANPVERVSWIECRRTLSRVALRLPTEAEWEYAARAGTNTPWWCGEQPSSIGERRAGNLADEFAEGHGAPASWGNFHTWSDGATVHAAVGSYAPNAFGLHDVIGNVAEWCSDELATYPEAENEERSDSENSTSSHRVYRGGTYMITAPMARSTVRFAQAPNFRINQLGVRPARAIE